METWTCSHQITASVYAHPHHSWICVPLFLVLMKMLRKCYSTEHRLPCATKLPFSVVFSGSLIITSGPSYRMALLGLHSLSRLVPLSSAETKKRWTNSCVKYRRCAKPLSGTTLSVDASFLRTAPKTALSIGRSQSLDYDDMKLMQTSTTMYTLLRPQKRPNWHRRRCRRSRNYSKWVTILKAVVASC